MNKSIKSPRVLKLIKNGYDENFVKNCVSITDNEIQYIAYNILSEEEQILSNLEKTSRPIAILIGGQPGSGKSTIAAKTFKNFENSQSIIITMDNYRQFHPMINQIQANIKTHWQNLKETENDSPGNDFAELTNNFAGRLTDIIISKATDKGYNIILDWGLREPIAPIDTINNLYEKNYDISIKVLSIYRKISYEACMIRANIINSITDNILTRKITKEFHDLICDNLPDSIQTIYENSKEKISSLELINRNGEIIYSSNISNIKTPKEILELYINNEQYSKNINNSVFVTLKTATLQKIISISDLKRFSSNKINFANLNDLESKEKTIKKLFEKQTKNR